MKTSRRFLFHLPFAAAAFGAAAEAQQPSRRFIIDGHQHYQNTTDYFDRVVRVYQPRNAIACVNGFMRDWPKIRDAAKRHPDVIVPYGRISVDNRGAAAEVEKFAAEGARGIKMHTPHHNWDDPEYFPIYDRIDRAKLVALFHTGIASHRDEPEFTSMARMKPEFLDTIARGFPNLYIQGAHLGNPWYAAAAEAARWCPKLYFDVTGSTLIKKAHSLGIFREYLWWQGPMEHSSPHAVYAFEKLVFGTDEEPEHLDVVVGRYEAMFHACEVPEPSQKKVFGETLAGILGIKPRA